MKNKNLHFTYRTLHFEDQHSVFELFRSCEDYFLLSQGYPACDAQEFFTDCPPGRTIEHKHLFGIFHDNSPIAVADIVEDYPKPGTWITGLLIVHPQWRRHGVATSLFEYMLSYAQHKGANIYRVGVIQHNTFALSFWKKLHFTEVSLSQARQYGKIETQVIVLERTI